MSKKPAIIEHLIEFGQNMVPMNLGSLLNELDYKLLKQKVENEEWEYIEDTLCGPCTKGFIIGIDRHYYEKRYRIMFVDYNNTSNRHLVSLKDDILIVEVIALGSNDKRNIFINRKYYYEPFENDYTIEINEKIQR